MRRIISISSATAVCAAALLNVAPVASAAAPLVYTTLFNETVYNVVDPGSGESSKLAVQPGGDVEEFDLDDAGTTMVTLVNDGSARFVWLKTPGNADTEDGSVSYRVDRGAGEGSTRDVMVSPNGEYLVFSSDAPDMLPGVNGAGSYQVVYRYQVGSGELRAVSLNADAPTRDAVQPSVANDGSVAYLMAGESGATQVFLYDSVGLTTEKISVTDAEGSELTDAAITSVAIAKSADEFRVAFSTPGQIDAGIDTNEADDVLTWSSDNPYVFTYASVDEDGIAQGGALTRQALNSVGDLLAISSAAALVSTDGDADSDVYLIDLSTGMSDAATGLRINITERRATGSYFDARMSDLNVAFLGGGHDVKYSDGSSSSAIDAFVYSSDDDRMLRMNDALDGTAPSYGGNTVAASVANADVDANMSYAYWSSRAENVSTHADDDDLDVFRTQVPGKITPLYASGRALANDGARATEEFERNGITEYMTVSVSDDELIEASVNVTSYLSPGVGTLIVNYTLHDTATPASSEGYLATVYLTNRFGDRGPIFVVPVQGVITPVVTVDTPDTYLVGGNATVRAHVLDELGNPISSYPTSLYRRVGDGSELLLGTVLTDSNGTATFTITPTGPGLVFAAVEASTSLVTVQPAESSEVGLTAASTLTRNSVSVTGTTITVNATVVSGAAGTLYLQRYDGARWVNIANANMSTTTATVSASLPAGSSQLRLRYSAETPYWTDVASASFTGQPKLRFSTVYKSRTGSTLTVKSKVIVAAPGKKVSLQRYSGGKWSTVAYAYQSSTGGFSIVWRNMPYGSSTLRLVATGTGTNGYATGTSSSFTVRR